jgi:hypothetical protein
VAFFRRKSAAGISTLRPGNATVHIAYLRPNPPFDFAYGGTVVPILTVDNEPIEVEGWDTITTITLPAGRYRLKVTNRYASIVSPIAPARLHLELQGGDDRRLVYQAPELPARSGHLRDADQVPEFNWPHSG